MRRQAAAGQTLQSLFVAVVEAMSGEPAIAKVERLPLARPDLESAAVRITFAGGREDVCLVSLRSPATAAGTDAPAVATADGKFGLRGRIGLVSTRGGAAKAWLVGGSELRYPGGNLALKDGTLKGTLSAVARRQDGGTADALVTDAALPEGAALNGRWLSLSFGPYKVAADVKGAFPLAVKEQTGISEMFQIDHVARRDGKTWIYLAEDPQLSLKNGKATELLRPHRTFEGPCTFEVLLSNCSGGQTK